MGSVFRSSLLRFISDKTSKVSLLSNRFLGGRFTGVTLLRILLIRQGV